MKEISKRRTRAASPQLLEAARAAYTWIGADETGRAGRDAVLQKLADVLTLCEDPERCGVFTFITTPTTGEHLLDYVYQRTDNSAVHTRLIEALHGKVKRTKQRTYFSIETDFDLLRRLRIVLNESFPRGSRRALQRVVEQIDKVLSKHPLVALAEIT